MRYLQIITIVFLVLLVYLSANYYIFIHGYNALPSFNGVHAVYILIFTFCSFAYLASRPLENSRAIKLHHILYYIGSLWFAAILYFLMFVLVVDLVRLANIAIHFLPDIQTMAYADIKLYAFALVLMVVIFLLGIGFRNAANPVVKKLELKINKKCGDYKELTIAMVSDIHLGSLINKAKIADMVDKINELHPDIILLAGDILDEIQEPIFREDIGAPLSDFIAPFGVFAITGNHEFIGGANKAVEYLQSKNITILRDSLVLIKNSFYLAGRDDKDGARFTTTHRKKLKDILENRNSSLPLILMDHQPFKLNEAVENEVDLQLSGHTHNGQFWPINYITKKVFEVSWGYKRIENTHFYVSCGYGTWGPPIRLGNTPEIVLIRLLFQ